MKIYTTKEVAKILNVTVRTIYNYIDSGDLKAVKLGRYWRIKEEELIKYVESLPSNRESQ